MRRRSFGDALEGNRAETAARGVDDAAHADVVVGVGEHPQVGDQVAHLAAAEEAHAPGHLVGDVFAQQHLFQGAGEVVGAHQHRAVGVAQPAAQRQAADLPHDPFRLLGVALGVLRHHPRSGPAAAPQPLRAARAVVADDGVGERQDRSRRAVVLLQLDLQPFREVAAEVVEVRRLRAAPGVDRLIVVAHHADVARRRGKSVQDLVLAPRSVLELVHHHVAVARPDGVAGRAAQQLQRQQDQVVEIHRLVQAQPAPVGGHQSAQLLARGFQIREVGAGAHAQPRYQALQQDRICLREVGVQAQVGGHLAQELRAVLLIVHGYRGRGAAGAEPQLAAVAAHQLQAEGVEGAHRRDRAPGAPGDAGPFAHLGRGLVGEGEGDDRPRVDALAQQAREAGRDDPGLARSGAGQHHHRPARR